MRPLSAIAIKQQETSFCEHSSGNPVWWQRHTPLAHVSGRLSETISQARQYSQCRCAHRRIERRTTFIVVEQLRKPASVILEPIAPNTAAAIAPALVALSKDRDALLMVLPSDHVILNEAAFMKAALAAARIAADDHLVAFGIEPGNPNTGYGYIRRGAALKNGSRCTRSMLSLRNLISLRLKSSWRAATTTGIGACSCSRLPPTWMSWG